MLPVGALGGFHFNTEVTKNTEDHRGQRFSLCGSHSLRVLCVGLATLLWNAA